MRKTAFVVFLCGMAVLLYFFFLPILLLMAAPKTNIGDGYSIIFFPPHADPVLRERGASLGAVIAATGGIALFVTRNRHQPSPMPVLWLVGTLVGLAAVVSLVTVQSYVDQLPDHLSDQYQALLVQFNHKGLSVGWPSEEAVNTEDYTKARATIEVVITYPSAKDRNHVYVQRIADTLYQGWYQACLRAALEDGATFNQKGIQRPHKWTKWPVVDPAECAVYLRDQISDWTIMKSRHGTVTIEGSPP